jgi:hypothetical protein
VVCLGGSLGLRQFPWVYYNCFYGLLWVVITLSRLESLLKASPNKVFLSKLSLIQTKALLGEFFKRNRPQGILRGGFTERI